MRAGSERHHAEEGEGAVLAIDRDELAEGKAGAEVSGSQGKEVCREEEVVGSVRLRP